MIQIKNMSKLYGSDIIHDNFSYEFIKDKITCIIGGSGIGKTTLLRCITGLEVYTGSIKVSGKISYMFQEDRLMPWMSVEDNILLPLKLEGKSVTSSDRHRLLKFAQFFKVDKHLNKPIYSISGGEKQRILMVRALINLPDILLLDEPFKSLDETLYTEMFKQFKTFCEKSHITVIFVTHHKILS